MNRRNFLQSLPAAAATSCTLGTLLAPPSAQPQANYVAPREVEDSAYTFGPISGAVGRALMPPNTPCPLPQSQDFHGLRFTGRFRDYRDLIRADTWYPSWAADGTLYSCYADGTVVDSAGRKIAADCSRRDWEIWFRRLGLDLVKGQITRDFKALTTTGNAVITGDDPFALTVRPLELSARETPRYEGYYPCANLYYRGVWYCGCYYCERWLNDHNVPITYELGGVGGFRISADQGKSWQDSSFDDQNPLFPEKGRCSGGPPIKIGTPHFVDLGMELQHSPDGFAYLTGHGTRDPEGTSNWCSGDAVFMTRVRPSPTTINDPGAYEYFAGLDAAKRPIWSKDFSRIAPVIEWPGHAGCVNVTYHPYLKKYFAFLCSGWVDGDAGTYDTWVVESSDLSGPWHSVAYLKGMGGQAYFVCMPSKFLRPDSNKISLFYSSNWRPERAGIPSWSDPSGPPGKYGLCVAEFELIGASG